MQIAAPNAPAMREPYPHGHRGDIGAERRVGVRLSEPFALCGGHGHPARPTAGLPYVYASARFGRSSSFAAQRKLDWRPGRVYFLTLLVPSRDDRTLALTARSASRLPP
jgi:hypothetical protein